MFWPTWQASGNKKHTHNALEKIGNIKFYKINKTFLSIFYIPVGVRFFVAVQTVPGAQPTSYTTGTGSCPSVKRPECGAEHAPLSGDEVKERRSIHTTPLWAFAACSRVYFIFWSYITGYFTEIHFEVLRTATVWSSIFGTSGWLT
jgi:hypothetical protein